LVEKYSQHFLKCSCHNSHSTIPHHNVTRGRTGHEKNPHKKYRIHLIELHVQKENQIHYLLTRGWPSCLGAFMPKYNFQIGKCRNTLSFPSAPTTRPYTAGCQAREIERTKLHAEQGQASDVALATEIGTREREKG
jgi:hypothetical protein